jgi:uncharacterized protein
VAVWWGTFVESASAVARREREAVYDLAAAEEALTRLRALAARWDEVQPADALRADAARLCRVHPLRTADALQLAAARALCRGQPDGVQFVCADKWLAAAAAREGFQVVALG